MGIFDKAKEQAEKLTEQAKDKVADTKAGRERDRLYKELGAHVLATGVDLSQDDVAMGLKQRIEELTAELQD